MTECARRDVGDLLKDDLQALKEAAEPMRPRDRRAIRQRVEAVRWSLVEAPEVTIGLAAMGADWMKRAGETPWPDSCSKMGEHLLREYLSVWDAARLSRVALESTVRYAHASGDLLAQLVRTSLQSCGDEARCGLARMVTREGRGCTKCSIAHPDNRTLSDYLAEYWRSPQYRYIQAADNRMKHRNLMLHGIRASLVPSVEEIVVRQWLTGFSHDGRQHRKTTLLMLTAKIRRLQTLARPVIRELSVRLAVA